MQTLGDIDIRTLSEDFDLEAKASLGDGKHSKPKSFLESYSAMANTEGGVILLGVEEPIKGKYIPVGISNVDRTLKILWDTLNNPQQISCNLLTHNHVQTVLIEGKKIIRVNVPRAPRAQQPVYVGENPLWGTYRRNYEGDYKCAHDVVERMIAEKKHETRDAKILEGYSWDDINVDTFQAYRNLFNSVNSRHPWRECDDTDFLQMIHGWKRCRETKKEGLTLAGILMFGKMNAIQDAVTHYFLDYQERKSGHERWQDRISLDGTWSGNLFDFYRKVFQRLVADLKVPFRLRDGQRVEDTPVHEALREALVNTLIHADYSDRLPVKIEKTSDIFIFRNPGAMRIPKEVAIEGGESDCRNRYLQKMFRLVGLAEQAGSGISKIYQNWAMQHWRAPVLREEFEPDKTVLELRMVNLLPKEASAKVENRFGAGAVRALKEVEIVALVTAECEGHVTHARLCSISKEHPHDITKILAGLVRGKFLVSHGVGRGTYYELPEVSSLEPEVSSLEPEVSSLEPEVSSLEPEVSSLEPEVSSLENSDLWEIAASVRNSGRIHKEVVQAKILELCIGRYIDIRTLSNLLGRKVATLRNNYLGEMLKRGDLLLRYPSVPNHPDQAYTSVLKTEVT